MVLQSTSCLTWDFVAHQPARFVVLSCFLFSSSLVQVSQWTTVQVSSKLDACTEVVLWCICSRTKFRPLQHLGCLFTALSVPVLKTGRSSFKSRNLVHTVQEVFLHLCEGEFEPRIFIPTYTHPFRIFFPIKNEMNLSINVIFCPFTLTLRNAHPLHVCSQDEAYLFFLLVTYESTIEMRHISYQRHSYRQEAKWA